MGPRRVDSVASTDASYPTDLCLPRRRRLVGRCRSSFLFHSTMIILPSRALRVLAALAVLSSPVLAQTLPAIPTPAQAQKMLQNDPSLTGRLQQMLQSSGQTPEQVRERLKSAGYPDSLLDQYLPGGKADSTSTPSDQVFAAVRALGLAD